MIARVFRLVLMTSMEHKNGHLELTKLELKQRLEVSYCSQLAQAGNQASGRDP